MTRPNRTPRPDGGALEPLEPDEENDESNGGDGDEFSLDPDLPEDSLFDLEDYLDMYQVASKKKPFKILMALNESKELSTSELSMLLGVEGNRLHYPLRKLKDVGLIDNRRDPNTGTEEPYSYYKLTDMGRTVLVQGPAEGVKTLAKQEESLNEKYSK
jgi:DNA-binding MarR family transcriptional regulator